MPKELYNPANGNRLDLYVFEEPEAVAAARWKAKRRELLERWIADHDTSPFAREMYQRELGRLEG